MKIQLHKILFIIIVFISIVEKSYAYYGNVFIDGSYYSLNEANMTATLTKYNGDIKMPSEVTYLDKTYIVTKIDRGSFQYYTGKTVEIPNSVTDISASAFSNCSHLEYISLPNTITKINNDTFNGCKNLVSVNIPSSVTMIGGSAFKSTGLETITIPENVELICKSAFYGCGNLNTVYYNARKSQTSLSPNEMWSEIFGASGVENIIIGSEVEEIPEFLFEECKNLSSLTIPGNVKHLRRYCFSGCDALTDLKFNEGLQTLGYSCFSGCKSIQHIVIPGSVQNIDGASFQECSMLRDVTLMNGIDSIGDYAFAQCDSIKELTIPESVKSIGGYVLSQSKNVQRINFNATNCIYTPFQSGANGAYVNDYVLSEYCKEINFGPNVEYLPEKLCQYMKIEEIVIPELVRDLEISVCMGCENLKTITLPPNLQTINEACFSGCNNLTTIISLNPIPPVCCNGSVFRNTDKSKITLFVPYGAFEAYSKAPIWKDFFYIKEIDVAGINDTKTDSQMISIKDIFDINGNRRDTLQRGINIVRYSNDSVHKIIIK